MLLLATISVGLGAALGVRFKFFILIPVILLILLAAFAGTVAISGGVSAVFISLGLTIAGIQIGYFLGAATRHVGTAERQRWLRSRIVSGSIH
jgi:hypothetical protein